MTRGSLGSDINSMFPTVYCHHLDLCLIRSGDRQQANSQSPDKTSYIKQTYMPTYVATEAEYVSSKANIENTEENES